MEDFAEAIVIFFGTLIVGLALIVAVGLLMSWPVMIMFGVVHVFWPFIPAFGFWQSYAIYILVAVLFKEGNSSSSKD